MTSSHALTLSLAAMLWSCAGPPPAPVPGPPPAAAPPPAAEPTEPPSSTSAAPVEPPAPPAPEPKATVAATRISLALGEWRACAALADGGLSCWGSELRHAPRRVAHVSDVVDAIVTREGLLVLYADGRVGVSGAPANGFDGLRDVTAIDAEGLFRCALRKAGRVVCAGSHQRMAARNVPGLARAVALDVGPAHGCAIIEGGAVRCWGNIKGTGRPSAARPVRGIVGATRLSVGNVIGCASGDDRQLRCFTLNDLQGPHIDAGPVDAFEVTDRVDGMAFPVLCRATGARAACHFVLVDEQRVAPDKPLFSVTLDHPVRQMRSSHDVLCLRDEPGGVLCLGNNSGAMLARPHPGLIETPTKVPGLPKMAQVDLEEGGLCGVSEAGEAWCRYGGRSAKVAGLSHDVARLTRLGDLVCGIAKDGRTSCFAIDGDRVGKAQRVPVFDGARMIAVAPSLPALIGVVTATGTLAFARLPQEDELASLALTPVAGLQDLERVALRSTEITIGGTKRTLLVATDARGQAFEMEFEYDAIAIPPRRAPAADGSLAAPGDISMTAARRCGRDEGGRFVCRHPASSLGGRDDLVVVMDRARHVSASGETYCGVDEAGVARCLGEAEELVGSGAGIKASKTPLPIALQ